MVVKKLEDLRSTLHAYFNGHPQRHLDFTKLVEDLKTQGLKILKNVTSKWILLLQPIQRVLKEYYFLMAKIKKVFATFSAHNIFFLMSNIQMLFLFLCVLPLLESVENLIKFAQLKEEIHL